MDDLCRCLSKSFSVFLSKIAFDSVMKIITENLKIFFFIYDLIRTVAKKTSQFCHCYIGTGSDINLALNDRIELSVNR